MTLGTWAVSCPAVAEPEPDRTPRIVKMLLWALVVGMAVVFAAMLTGHTRWPRQLDRALLWLDAGRWPYIVLASIVIFAVALAVKHAHHSWRKP
jgi:hypothetical protein